MNEYGSLPSDEFIPNTEIFIRNKLGWNKIAKSMGIEIVRGKWSWMAEWIHIKWRHWSLTIKTQKISVTFSVCIFTVTFVRRNKREK